MFKLYTMCVHALCKLTKLVKVVRHVHMYVLPVSPQVAPNGLVMSFLGGFDGVVSLHHLPSPSLHSTENYHPKKKFRVRVLWVDMAVKTIGLTIQKEVVSGRSYQFDGMEIGDIFEGIVA